jgi:hypothetical protein
VVPRPALGYSPEFSVDGALPGHSGLTGGFTGFAVERLPHGLSAHAGEADEVDLLARAGAANFRLVAMAPGDVTSPLSASPGDR